MSAAAVYTAIIEPDEDAFHAYIPALPGCHTFGGTVDEARANLIEAAELYLDAMRADGEEIPVEHGEIIITQLSVPLAS
jgi:predicted RNase H-like HicB family nuclease